MGVSGELEIDAGSLDLSEIGRYVVEEDGWLRFVESHLLESGGDIYLHPATRI